MRPDVLAHLQHIRIGVRRRHLGLGDVAGEDRGLVGQQEEAPRDLALVGREVHGERGPARVEGGLDLREDGVFRGRRLVAALDLLADALAALPDRLEVGEHQLGVDHLDVADRIDPARHVMDVRVLEAADDLHHRVDLAHVGEELVAEPLALARAFDEARDVDELDRRGDDDPGLGDALQRGEPRVRHRHHADVGIDGAERIVRRFRFPGPRDGVEQGGLADVGEAYDSGSEHGYNPRSYRISSLTLG